MKLLITGSRGQLGQDLVKVCRGRGIAHSASDLEELDIVDLPAVRDRVKTERPTAVINCAAYNEVDRAEDDFVAACRVNAIGPRNLAIAAEEAGIALMHFSTDFVFDGEKSTPYTIADRPNPINRYGQSKLLGEELVRSLCRRHFVVRLSWVFGAAGMNFPKKVIEWARGKKTLRVITGQVACPSYTADLIGPILEIIDTGAFGVYHLCNRGHCSRFEWARFVLERAAPGVEAVEATGDEFPAPARRPKFSALDRFPLESTIHRLPGDWQEATERFLLDVGALK